MEGIVFTEFLDMIEEMWGIASLDKIVDTTLASGGIYTIGGTYPPSELTHLVHRTHANTGEPIRRIYLLLGRRLFNKFTRLDKEVFEQYTTAFDFLDRLHEYLSGFVHRIHPDLETSDFISRRIGPSQMIVTYRSKKKLGDLAEGIIQGVFEHYAEEAEIFGEKVSETGDEVQFTIQKMA